MQPEQLFLFPFISENPGQAEFFWYRLPYAIPGFVTFFIGISLALFGILALFNKERKHSVPYYLSFTLNCLSMGALGLILSFRSVVLDKEILLLWNYRLYYFVLMVAPSALHLIYYITEKKYKIIQWSAFISWAFVLLGFYSLFDLSAFSGEWTEYSFGSYPKPGQALKVWGICGTIGYFLAFPFIFKYFYQEGISDNAYVFAGLNLSFLLLIFSLPGFIGFPLYPGAYFSFIAMALVAHGVFKSDFLSLNELFFKKSGIYYFQNLVLGFTFLLLSFLIAYGLTPSDLVGTKWYPWALIPLLSCVAVFSLSLLIAGLNPTEKLNQIASLSILCLAFYLIQSTIKTFSLLPIVSLRLSQIFYFFFIPALSFNVRFIYITLGLETPKFMRFTDIFVLIISLLAFTDSMFTGYYKFYFGDVFSVGLPVKFYSFLVVLNGIFVIRDWLKVKNSIRINLFIFSVLLSAVLIGLSVPASLGYEYYPFGNFQIIPACLIALGIFKYGVLPYDRNVLSISLRFAFFSIVIVPILFFLIFPMVSHNAPKRESVFYLILFLSPLSLFIFQVLFVFSRPIVKQVVSLIQEKNLEQERLVNVGQLASGIIHDLKNPMVSIKGYAEMASDKIFSEEERVTYLGLISSEIDRLSDMVYDILDFTKGKVNLNIEEVSVKEYIHEIIDFLRPEFRRQSVEIQLCLEREGFVLLDKNRFRRVILNLLSNAKEAMQDGGILYFEISLTPLGTIFWISDTGNGIPADIQGQIFSPFVTHGKKKGTGLGLTIVKSIVEAHGGSVSFLSEEGRGTNIFIFLPVPEEGKI